MGELGVAVPDQEARDDPELAKLAAHVSGLLGDPRAVIRVNLFSHLRSTEAEHLRARRRGDPALA